MRRWIEVDHAGRVTGDSDASSALAERVGRYLLLGSPDEALIAVDQAVAGDTSSDDRVVLAGDLALIPFSDIVGTIANARLDGVLRVGAGSGVRTLVFASGELRGAASSHVGERLSDVLGRLGYLKRDDIDSLLAGGADVNRLGRLAVERELLSEHDLWTAMQEHVLAIFDAILIERRGVFTLSTGSTEGVTSVPGISTEGLLLEGLRRIDELARFRTRIPSSDTLMESLRVPDVSVEGVLREVCDVLADQPATVMEIARRAQLSNFEVHRVLFELTEAGFVRVSPDPAHRGIGSSELTRVLGAYDTAVREIFRVARTEGAEAAVTEVAHSALASDPRHARFFSDVGISPDGRLDGLEILPRLEAASEVFGRQPEALLRDVLSQALLFLLFVVGERVDPDVHDQLQVRVKAIVAEQLG